ncbi:AbrB/MazE/SpoVT family DNA-binding domain-containing protein [Planctomycetota bacterium]
MKPIATTKMSSKGQVVIPEGIRQQLGLDTGTQFVVVGQKDVIILKTIAAPAMSQFDGLVKQARKQAKDAGLKRSDIAETIAEARKSK